MSVTWTINGDGQYLVESKEHLLQIMNNGSLYTDAGTAPSDYLSSSFLQTSDIDLADDHENIVPIGLSPVASRFKGIYDGGLFEISNWSYSDALDYSGLFGFCSGATLKHIRLSGVWTLGSATTGGFLAGRIHTSTTLDTEVNVSSGTVMDGTNLGGLIGLVSDSTVVVATVSGTMEFSGTRLNVGGLFSTVQGSSTQIIQCRNLAIFPSGISSSDLTGGIMALTNKCTITKCLNGMVGDMTGSDCGGIAGKCTGSSVFDCVVNSMRGSMTGTTAGGIIGMASLDSANTLLYITNTLNYMTGNLTSGGIIGLASRLESTSDISITTSVVAMNGSATEAVCQFSNFVPSTLEVTVDTSFGGVFTENNYGTTTMVINDALLYETTFQDLPYFEMITDFNGNLYTWDFMFGNIGGKYETYTHLSVHKTNVSGPFVTDFGLAADNEVVFMTFTDYDSSTLYIDNSLSVVSTTADIVYNRDTLSTIYKSKTAYLNSSGYYDITNEDNDVLSFVNFSTGDQVKVKLKSKKSLTTTFVSSGQPTIDISNIKALLIYSSNSSNPLTMQLNDDSFVEATVNENSFLVGGVLYMVGDYFVMDGKKVNVIEI